LASCDSHSVMYFIVSCDAHQMQRTESFIRKQLTAIWCSSTHSGQCLDFVSYGNIDNTLKLEEKPGASDSTASLRVDCTGYSTLLLAPNRVWKNCLGDCSCY